MRITRKLLSLLLALAMILSVIPSIQAREQESQALTAEPLAREPQGTARISLQSEMDALQHPSKEEIAAKWATVTTAETLYQTEPSVSSPYAAGTLSSDFLESGITYLNYVRFVAGLPAVTLDDTLNADAQHGAVLLAAVDYLSHYPEQPSDMDDTFYSRGYAATTSSNISARYGYEPLTCLQGSVKGCMNDSGDNNLATVGHRRWLLNPTLGKVGFGYAQSASGWSYIVTKVFDDSGVGCSFDYISWPTEGNQPTNLFGVENPWSVTLNSSVYKQPSADTVEITITRVSDGKQWYFDSTTGQPSTHTNPYMIVNNQWYGLPNCIIFHPGSANVDSYEGVFQVKITGIYYTDGTAAEINYEVDFFDVDSVSFAQDGWVQEEGVWYYFVGGKAQTGWQQIDGVYYFFNSDGSMQTGWYQSGEEWYYFKPSGAMATGWVQVDNNWYYMNADGVMQTGWLQQGSTWYYLRENGTMATGWALVDRVYYYFDQDGKMVTGWVLYNGTYYYMKSNGAMAKGWQLIDHVYFYFEESGAMKTGWLLYNGDYYYLKPNGAMATGWIKVGSDWYYMNAGGDMRTGWLQEGDLWYYLKPDGAMATGKYWMNNRYYTFTDDGVWIS